MGDLLSPSASGELNLLKVENNGTGGSAVGKAGLMRRVREAIDPAAAAMTYIEAAEITAKGVSRIASDLVNAGTPKEFAIAQAYEIYRGAEKLTSVGRAVSYAEDELSEGEYTVPDEKFIRNFVSSVEDVCDDDILRMFGKILAGEAENPGSFSKRTMRILSDMSRKDAEAFVLLCSVSVGGCFKKAHHPITPIIYGFGPNGSWEQLVDSDSLANLGNLGLIHYRPDMILPTDAGMDFSKAGAYEIIINEERYVVINPRGISVLWLNVKLTPEGSQLATLCEAGCAPQFKEMVLAGLENLGCIISLDEERRWL